MRAPRSLASWCTGGLVALMVSAPLVTSEAYATLGTHAPAVMMWLVLLVATLAALVAEKRCGVHGGWPLVGFGALAATIVVSGLVMGPAGHLRPVINAVWQWVGFLVAYFLMRQLIRSPAAIRAACALGVATAVGLSAFGLYQYAVAFPALRAEYQANPQKALRDAGISAPPGSPQERLFIDRLASKEPTATFALTNSLAGFLAPWLVVALGIAIESPSGRSARGRTLNLAAAFATVAMACTLALTKSRTAALATLAGAAALGTWYGARGRWRRILPAAGLLAAVTAAIAMTMVVVDRDVWAEAPSSVVYRLEYWQSTAAMIRDYPWLGCAPGNFKDFYTAYKLPQASETVSDPHHFLFEIWATSGSVAALLFVALLGSFFLAVRRPETAPPPAAATNGPTGEAATLYAGALVGVLVAVGSGWTVGVPLHPAFFWTAVPAGAATIWALDGWVREGTLPTAVLVIAIATLLVNLLFAGGIAYAGVAIVLWTLMALASNQRDAGAPARGGPWLAGTLLVSAILAAACAYSTLYRPVLKGSLLVSEGRTRDDPDDARRDYLAAAAADPYWSQPWTQLADLALRNWLMTRNEAAFGEFRQHCERALAIDRRSSELHRQKGDWYMSAFRVTQRRADARIAIEAFTRAVELYPNSGIARARLAWAWHLAGDADRALAESRRALELDTLNPHSEQQFANRTDLGSWAGTGDATVEQLMDELRRSHGPDGGGREGDPPRASNRPGTSE